MERAITVQVIVQLLQNEYTTIGNDALKVLESENQKPYIHTNFESDTESTGSDEDILDVFILSLMNLPVKQKTTEESGV